MNRRIAAVIAAVVLAIVGTLAVYRYGKSADSRAVASARPTTVVVTVKRVAAGTTWADAVKAGSVTTQKMPADSAPSTALSSVVNAPVGSQSVAQADIAPGQIVMREAFGQQVSKTGALSIPKGNIAISVSVPANAVVANYVGPGSKVIIFVTAKLKSKDPRFKDSTGDDLLITRTVVRSSDVLATSGSAPTTVEGAKGTADPSSAPAELVTLSLTQLDAERVILAQKAGELYLGLLSSSSRTKNDRGVVNAGVFQPVPIFVNQGN